MKKWVLWCNYLRYILTCNALNPFLVSKNCHLFAFFGNIFMLCSFVCWYILRSYKFQWYDSYQCGKILLWIPFDRNWRSFGRIWSYNNNNNFYIIFLGCKNLASFIESFHRIIFLHGCSFHWSHYQEFSESPDSKCSSFYYKGTRCKIIIIFCLLLGRKITDYRMLWRNEMFNWED